jgi:phage minor structural protein
VFRPQADVAEITVETPPAIETPLQAAEIAVTAPVPTWQTLPFTAPSALDLFSAAGVHVALLPLAADVRIRQAINSLDALTFTYPRADSTFDLIIEGSIVRLDDQDYRVVQIDDARDATGVTGSITAEQHFVKLGDILKKRFILIDCTADDAMDLALADTGWTAGTVAPTGKASLDFQWASPLSILLAIADAWNGELLFDSQAKTVDLLTQIGIDNYASLIYRKNIEGLSRTRSAAQLYNRIWFEGKDGLTSARGYVEDARSIAAYGRRDYFWSDDTITSVATLVKGATWRLQAYRNPRASYSCTAWNIAPAVASTSWATVALGDTVKVYDEDLGINITTRVYEREWAPLDTTVPDNLTLSTDREWFKDLSEKLGDLVDPTNDAESDRTPCFGEGGYSWLNANNVPPEWQGDGKPHIWTAAWAGVDPVLSGGIWYTGYDTDADGLPDTGPRGTDVDGLPENATYEPHGLDLDGDGIEDFWPFGEPGSYGVAGGHCYDADETPESWDYGGAPYLASTFLPVGYIYDMTGIDFYGYDANQNGVPDEILNIEDMPQPFYFDIDADHVLLGTDLGGGNISWAPFAPAHIPIFHNGASLDGVYLTGWDDAGEKNFSGPVGYDTNADEIPESWSPDPIDTNDDGKADLWPYGDAYSFGQNAYVGTCGAIPSSIAPVAPDLPSGGGGECGDCLASTTLVVDITATGAFVSEEWTHGFDTGIDQVQLLVTAELYDLAHIQIRDLRIERVSRTSCKLRGYATVS